MTTYQIDPRTPQGRKALGFLQYRTRVLLELLKLPPKEERERYYSKAELCLICAERGIKRQEANLLAHTGNSKH